MAICVVRSLTNLLTYSLTHILTQALTRSITYWLTYSLTCLLTLSLTHSLIHLRTHSLIHFLTHSFTHLLKFTSVFRGNSILAIVVSVDNIFLKSFQIYLYAKAKPLLWRDISFLFFSFSKRPMCFMFHANAMILFICRVNSECSSALWTREREGERFSFISLLLRWLIWMSLLHLSKFFLFVSLSLSVSLSVCLSFFSPLFPFCYLDIALWLHWINQQK